MRIADNYLGVAPVFKTFNSWSFGFLERPATDGAVGKQFTAVEICMNIH